VSDLGDTELIVEGNRPACYVNYLRSICVHGINSPAMHYLDITIVVMMNGDDVMDASQHNLGIPDGCRQGW
jgi:hypothetical protein